MYISDCIRRLYIYTSRIHRYRRGRATMVHLLLKLKVDP